MNNIMIGTGIFNPDFRLSGTGERSTSRKAGGKVELMRINFTFPPALKRVFVTCNYLATASMNNTCNEGCSK